MEPVSRTSSVSSNRPRCCPIWPMLPVSSAPGRRPITRSRPRRLIQVYSPPALTIWQMNVSDGVPAPVDLAAGGEDVLIVRPMADVEVRSIPKGSLEFIQALKDGRSVLAALEAGLIANPQF